MRYRNTVHVHHRNIFIEDGLVSTVTAYHKGYNIVGSTKLIHRYLLKEVSVLVVYYLWFILPFWRKLELLVWGDKALASPYLWAKGEGSWDSARLTEVLKDEAKLYLKTYLNITFYRHAAAAISRVHLKSVALSATTGLERTIRTSRQATRRGSQEPSMHEGQKKPQMLSKQGEPNTELLAVNGIAFSGSGPTCLLEGGHYLS